MLHRDAKTRRYAVEIKHRTFGRVHLRLATTQRAEAVRLEVALQQLLDAGEPVRDLVQALRARKLTLAAVAECVQQRLPFDRLRPSTWPTLGDAFQQYRAELRLSEQREGTAAIVERAERYVLRHFEATRPVESLTHEDVAAFKAFLLAEGLHSNTVALYLTKLGALYTWLQKRENRRARAAKRVPATLFSPVDREEHIPAHQQTRVRFLSEAEAERLLAVTPARVRLGVALGIFAGLRVGEIVTLRVGIDVDLATAVLHVQSREGWSTKTRTNRAVEITSALLPYLEAHLAGGFAGERYLFPGGQYGLDDRTHRTVRNVQRIVADAIGAADLERGRASPSGVTVHTLRHTFASWLVMAGADLFTVAKLMGNSPAMVEATYGHLSPHHRRQTVELLSARWAARGTVAP